VLQPKILPSFPKVITSDKFTLTVPDPSLIKVTAHPVMLLHLLLHFPIDFVLPVMKPLFKEYLPNQPCLVTEKETRDAREEAFPYS